MDNCGKVLLDEKYRSDKYAVTIVQNKSRVLLFDRT